MVEILHDLSLYDIPQLGKKQKNVLVISKTCDEKLLCVLEKIVQDLFSNKGLVFEAAGFSANLKDISDFLCSEAVRYHEGDANRFFVRNFPECLHIIQSEQFTEILKNCWTNAIHERRRIFILEYAHIEEVMNEFDKTAFSDYFFAKSIWEYVDMIFENVLDDPRNSIIIICKEHLWSKIASIFSQEYPELLL